MVGASTAEQDAVRVSISQLVWFPDGIERIITLPAGLWEGIERFNHENNWPPTGIAEVAFEHAQTTKFVMDDFEARLRRSFEILVNLNVGFSFDPAKRPANS